MTPHDKGNMTKKEEIVNRKKRAYERSCLELQDAERLREVALANYKREWMELDLMIKKIQEKENDSKS